MNFKSTNKKFSKSKLMFWGIYICIILISAKIDLAQTESKTNEVQPEIFFFSFMLKSRLNPEFKLCVPITEEIPFQIEWKDQEIKSSLTVLLKKTVEGKYPLRVTVTEGTEENKIYEGMEESKLILEKPYKSTSIESALFNNTHEKNLNLSRKGCDFTEGSSFYFKKNPTNK